MNVTSIINQLESRYPEKTIIKNSEENATEILCEIEPAKNHPEYSLAVAVIDKNLPHYHKKSTEIYRVIQGELTLHVEGKIMRMSEGKKHTILPYQIHWAEGNETWIEVFSKPGWTIEDHIVEDQSR